MRTFSPSSRKKNMPTTKRRFGSSVCVRETATGELAHSTVEFHMNGETVTATAEGNGPVDSTFKAIESKVNSGAEMVLYSVNAITTGRESQGEVTVRLSLGGRIVNGVGADPNIIAASAKAYLAALNKLQSRAGDKLNPQHGQTGKQESTGAAVAPAIQETVAG